MSYIRGSSAAFIQDGQVITQYGTGCFRQQLIEYHGIKDKFDPIIEELGHLNEDRHARLLEDSGLTYVREKEVHSVDLSLTGHIDFILGAGVVHELKSGTSPNTYREVFKRGCPKSNNLAQLVTYLLLTEQPYGRLIYSYYVKGKDTPEEEIVDRVFEVLVDDDGSIMVDWELSCWNAQQVVDHWTRSINYIQNKEIGPRPFNWADAWKSPCKWCTYAKACNMYDMNLVNVDGFLAEATTLAMETFK